MGERILYFDCSAGVSGDMILGGLLDLGLPLKRLKAELKKLPARGYRLKASKGSRAGLRGIRLRVEAPGDSGGRRFEDFSRLIEKSRLTPKVKERSIELLRRLYAAEARVHGLKLEKVHLHELGSLDTLVDVVGAVAGFELLGIEAFESSPLNLGGGDVRMEHGRLAVPAPATLELLKGVPVFSDGSSFERTTPTGALLISGFARRFGPWPSMTIERVGYGLGTRDPKDGRPNALRLALGAGRRSGAATVLVLETTIDDMSPQLAGYLLERLLRAGALDVFITPVQMKKSRPGLNLTVIAPPARRQDLTEILFAESTTLGVRCHEAERQMLEREVVEVETRYGPVPVKLGMIDGKLMNAAPEFENCRRIATRRGISLKEVQQEALSAFRERRDKR